MSKLSKALFSRATKDYERPTEEGADPNAMDVYDEICNPNLKSSGPVANATSSSTKGLTNSEEFAEC